MLQEPESAAGDLTNILDAVTITRHQDNSLTGPDGTVLREPGVVSATFGWHAALKRAAAKWYELHPDTRPTDVAVTENPFNLVHLQSPARCTGDLAPEVLAVPPPPPATAPVAPDPTSGTPAPPEALTAPPSRPSSRTGVSEPGSDFVRQLQLLGRLPDDVITVCTKAPEGQFEVHWTTATGAPKVAEQFSGTHDCWFGQQPLRSGVDHGRGNARDVIGVTHLYADLDYIRVGKEQGLTTAQARGIIRDISTVYGALPTYVTATGNGVQPVWVLAERVDPVQGAVLLMRHRELVIKTADHHGGVVDSGVFDLARILRVAGPPNVGKTGVDDPRQTGLLTAGPLVCHDPDEMERIALALGRDATTVHDTDTGPLVDPGARLSYADVCIRLDAALPPGAGTERITRSRPSGGTNWGKSVSSSGDRIFTRDQFLDYLLVNPGAVTKAKETPHGAGFNAALNLACFDIAAGVGDILSEEEAWNLALDIVAAQFPAGADARDYATIRSGFAQNTWRARRPTEQERLNPFSLAADHEAIWLAQGGLRTGNPPREASPEWPPPGLSEAEQEQMIAAAVAAELGTEVDAEPLVEIAPASGAAPPEPVWSPPTIPTSDGVFLSDEFWEARPVFGHLRQTAHAALASPEGVLLAGLALALVNSMPNVVLPAAIGTKASLNLMTLLCGGSGDGKSVCRKLAQEALQFKGIGDPYTFSPGSGQGISGQYQHAVREKGQPIRMEWHRRRALAMVEESDALAALAANPSSTLSSELRKAAMGEALGAGNIGDTATNLPEHSYRFVLMMCMQPALAGWLLSESAGGLPQRFIWACVRDPRVVRNVESPGVFPINLPIEVIPDPISGGPKAQHVMGYTEAIREEIVEAAIVRKERGDDAGVEFDGHAILARLKVAGGLALLDARANINDADWELAAHIVATSNATRAWVASIVAESAAVANAKQALAKGHARVVEEKVVERDKAQKLLESILSKLQRAGDKGVTKGKIRNDLGEASNELLDSARIMDRLLEAGQVRFEDIVDAKGEPSSRWFIVQS